MGWKVTMPKKVEWACPRCDKEMVRRTNKHKQKDFYGCSNFPDCRGTRELDGAEYPVHWADVTGDPNEGPWSEWDGADGWGGD